MDLDPFFQESSLWASQGGCGRDRSEGGPEGGSKPAKPWSFCLASCGTAAALHSTGTDWEGCSGTVNACHPPASSPLWHQRCSRPKSHLRCWGCFSGKRSTSPEPVERCWGHAGCGGEVQSKGWGGQVGGIGTHLARSLCSGAGGPCLWGTSWPGAGGDPPSAKSLAPFCAASHQTPSLPGGQEWGSLLQSGTGGEARNR